MGDKVEKNKMGGAFSSVGEGRNVYMVLVGKSKEKISLWRPRRKSEDKIKRDL
jgi:hypothetical protein